MNFIIKWGIITVLFALHLLMQERILPLYVHIAMALFIPILLILILNKKIPTYIRFTYPRIETLFLIMHLAIFSLYFIGNIYTWLPLLMFIIIEACRYLLTSEIITLNKQIKHVDQIREQFNETFKVVRSERHDFLKHISAIHFMLEKEEVKEAKKYLDELVGKYEETNLSIKGEKGVVAGVLNDAYRKATKIGISPYFDLDVPISSLPIKDVDLVSLIGNILNNSIEACEEWQTERKNQAMISLQFYKRSGLYILICKNNSLPIPTEILDELYQSYGHTTKSGDHEGLGTKIIHDIVKKYHGFLDFTFKDEQFTLKIKIPAVTN